MRSSARLSVAFRARIWMCAVCVATGVAGMVPHASADGLVAPAVEGQWARPSARQPARPIWGHAKGVRVGLAPLPGPRGLLRIYAPHVGLPELRVINFIAVEPIPAGTTRRGFSELEPSRLDGAQGKRFWSGDAPDNATPRTPESPARGVTLCDGGVETLRVFILVEPFENGAHVYLRLTFRADRPNEVGIAAFTMKDSRPLDHCVITATMGNYARLRRLHLRDKVVLAGDLWPGFAGDGFAPHRAFPLEGLWRGPAGDVLARATSDEKDPQHARYAPDTPPWWKYLGPAVTQYWRVENPDPKLAVQVNGRVTYWAGQVPIPGGVAYENFEVFTPYRDGQEFWFGVTGIGP